MRPSVAARLRPEDVIPTIFSGGEVTGRAARGGALVLTGQLVRFALQLLATVVLARLLTPAEFGLAAMAATLTLVFTMFADLGLAQATVQQKEVTHGQLSALFWVNAAFGSALTLACFAAAPGVAWFYDEPRLVGVVRTLAVGFFLQGLAAQHGALLNRQLRFPAVAAIGVAAALGGALVAVVLAVLGLGVWALVAQQLAFGLITLSGNWLAAGWWPAAPKRAPGVGAMLRFGGNMLVGNFFSYLITQADRVLIGAQLGKVSLGLYDRSGTLVQLPGRLILQPLNNVMIPALSRLNDRPDVYARTYLGAVEKIAMATMPPMVTAALLAPEIVTIAFGPGWEAAAAPFAWLALGLSQAPTSQTTSWLLTSQGRVREQARRSALTAAVTILAYAAGLPYGVEGVAIGAAAAYVGAAPCYVWFATRRGPVGFRPFVAAVVPGLSGAAAAAAAVTLARAAGLVPDHAIVAVLGLGAAAAVATLVLYLVLPRGRRGLVQTVVLVAGRVSARPSPRALNPSRS